MYLSLLLLANFGWRTVMDYSAMHAYLCDWNTGWKHVRYLLTDFYLLAQSINRQTRKIEMKGTVYPFRKGICIVSVNPLLVALFCFLCPAQMKDNSKIRCDTNNWFRIIL